MKKLLFLLFLNSQLIFAAPSDDFVFKIQTDNPGSSNSLNFYFSFLEPGSEYLSDYSVDCEDDGIIDYTITLHGTFNLTCSYPVHGTYTIRIIDNRANHRGYGYFHVFAANKPDMEDIVQWGTHKWTYMANVFEDCTNMKVTATDVPDFSLLSSLNSMFRNADKANPDTTNWDVSTITNFGYMFSDTFSANPNTSNWDTSSATNMRHMFENTTQANPDVSNWNMANVHNTAFMFRNAISANPDVSSWDTSSLDFLPHMFDLALSANPDVSAWDTANFSNIDYLFRNALSANPDVSGWDTSGIDSFEGVFQGAANATPDVSQWNTDLVNNMAYMFDGAIRANPNMMQWNFSNISSCVGCLVPNAMQGIFNGVKLPTASYDNLLIQLNTQNSNTDIEFDAGNSNYCSPAAGGARLNLFTNKNWTISDAGQDCSSSLDALIMVVKTDNPGSSNNTQFTIPTYSSGINIGYNYAVDCDNDGNYEVLGASTSYTCQYASAGTYEVRIVDTAGDLTGFPRIYFNNSGDRLKLLDVKQWGRFKWTSMVKAFFGTENAVFTAQDTPDFSQVASFSNMFREAHLANPYTKNWDVSNAVNMHWMFYRAYNATPDTSNWDTSQVSLFDGMFYEAFSANPDTSTWQTANATDMGFMFYNAISANPDTSTWDITQVTNMANMFKFVTLPLANYDAMLSGFASQAVNNNINFHGGFSQYCNANPDRAALIANNSWTIFDGGQECTPVVPPYPVQTTSPADNTPNIKVTCADVDNIIKIYASDTGGGGATYNNTVIANYTCASAGVQYFDAPVVLDGDFQMTATQTRYGDESAHSTSNPLLIDTVTNAPTSIIVNPLYATNGTDVYINLTGLEANDVNVSIVGATCQALVLPPFGRFKCVGTVGVNGFDNSDTTITVTDSYGNVNNDAHYTLIIDNTPPADPTSITTTPMVAANGTTVTTVLEGVELDATVQIPGMTCSPTPADATGTVTCTGVVGQNGLDGVDTMIRIFDLAFNGNLNNFTGLVVTQTEEIFSNGFEN